MSSQGEKYLSTVVRHLRSALGLDGSPGSMEELSKIGYLTEEPEALVDAGEISAGQRDAIRAVFREVGKIGELPGGARLCTDEHFRSAPEWEPTRKSIAIAIDALSNLDAPAHDRETDLLPAHGRPASYERFEREMTTEERSRVEAAVNLETPADNPLLAFPGVREKLVEHLKKHQPRNQEILDDGRVVVHRCKSDRVAVLLPTEDEGASFFFDVGDGRLLSYCYFNGEHDQWPNNDFEFVHTRVHPTTHFEWLTCFGEKITPVREVEGSMGLWEKLPKTTVGLFVGSLATVENDLRAL